MAFKLSVFLRRTTWLIVLAALLWAVLAANQGWYFFAALLLPLLLWQWHYPLRFPRMRWRYFPVLVFTFLTQLWRGALDVAKRALFASQFPHAGFASYHCRLTQPEQQQLLATLVSLLPGTCTVAIVPAGNNSTGQQQVELLLHILDQTANWQADVAAMEWQLARFMATPLPDEALL